MILQLCLCCVCLCHRHWVQLDRQLRKPDPHKPQLQLQLHAFARLGPIRTQAAAQPEPAPAERRHWQHDAGVLQERWVWCCPLFFHLALALITHATELYLCELGGKCLHILQSKTVARECQVPPQVTEIWAFHLQSFSYIPLNPLLSGFVERRLNCVSGVVSMATGLLTERC